MKTISNYTHTNINNYPITKSIYDQTYEDFIEFLNIDENDIDDDLYKLYEEYNYKNVDGNGLRSYEGYQKYLYESLVELLDPYKPQDFTDYVYNDCGGIIYHITNKNTYNKIIKYGLKPKNLTKNNNKRPYRLFFLCLKDNKELMTQARQISSTSNENIILKIDLNEYKNKLKFFKDTTAVGYDAYFTCEPIPPYCIKLYKEL